MSRYGRRELLRERHPDSNTGVLCGDGLVVIDLDVRSGGFEALTRRERAHGPLPETFTVITGSNGRHYYFRDSSRSLSSFLIEPGIEVKARGTQVVAPPSIHPVTGRSYVDDPAGPGWGSFAELPLWIAQLAPRLPDTVPEARREQGDFFRSLSPRRYAFDLAGATPDRRGMILCPSPLGEPDSDPSLDPMA